VSENTADRVPSTPTLEGPAARGPLLGTQSLAGLASERFYTVLKGACSRGGDAQVAAEAVRRADSGSLGPRELRLLLLETGAHPRWRWAKQAALTALARNPQHAISVLMLQCQAHGRAGPVFTEQALDNGRFATFVALIEEPDTIQGPIRTARSKKAARAAAAVGLLQLLTRRPEQHPAITRPVSIGSAPAGQEPEFIQMSQTSFSAALHAAAAMNAPPQVLAEEIGLRARLGQLTTADVHLLLFTCAGPAWTAARRAALGAAAAAGQAASILALYAAGRPEHTARFLENLPPASADRYTVCAQINNPRWPDLTATRTAATKKAARQAAAVGLLARVCAMPDPDPDRVEPRRPTGDGALGTVNHYVQSDILSAPTYHYPPAQGPAHRPVITCVAQSTHADGDIRAVGTSTSKALARAEAARHLLRLVEHGLGGH
jgi:hypothetical protein